MIRNQNNRIPHPAPDTKGETKQTIKTELSKTAQAENQEDGSFPADDHKAILYGMNKTSKTNGKRTNIAN